MSIAVSRSKRVLVTGAAGFTGRHLAARLRASGYRVFGLTERAAADADQLQADLLDAAAVTAAVRAVTPDYVVHLAAISFPGYGDVGAIYRTNLIGSQTLLESLAMQRQARRGVLLASSGTIYGGSSTADLDETTPPDPATHYAVSKLAMEKMAAIYADALPIVVARPFNYTGPGQREPFLVPKIVRHFADGVDGIELGNVDVVRDFLDVRTVVDAYARLLENPAAAGHTFNVCSGCGVSVRDLVGALERITSRVMPIRVNPQLVRANDPARIVGTVERLRAAIGELAPVPLATTLADMLQERRDLARGDAMRAGTSGFR